MGEDRIGKSSRGTKENSEIDKGSLIDRLVAHVEKCETCCGRLHHGCLNNVKQSECVETARWIDHARKDSSCKCPKLLSDLRSRFIGSVVQEEHKNWFRDVTSTDR